jgi:hypothetical protein
MDLLSPLKYLSLNRSWTSSTRPSRRPCISVRGLARSVKKSDRDRLRERLTPLNGGENSSFELIRESSLYSDSLDPLALQRLKIVQIALASNFAHEYIHLVECHSSGIAFKISEYFTGSLEVKDAWVWMGWLELSSSETVG